MTQPIDLPYVKRPEDVTSRNDRFHCTVLRSDMVVNGCVSRQATVRAGKRRLEWSMCTACALGQQIEANSGGPAEVQAMGNDSLGRPKGGWHGQNIRTGARPVRLSRPADFVGDLPPCASPDCPETRMRCGSTVPGGDPFCKGHRLSLAKRLSKERREVSEPEAAAPLVVTSCGAPRSDAVASGPEPPKTVFEMARPLKPPPLRVIEGGRVDDDGETDEPERPVPGAFAETSLSGSGDACAASYALLLVGRQDGPGEVISVTSAEQAKALGLPWIEPDPATVYSFEPHDTEPPSPAAKTDRCPAPAHVRRKKRRKSPRPKTFAEKLRDSERTLRAALLYVAGARRRR